MEPGETPEDCCEREVLEETCVSIEGLKLIGAWKADNVFDSECNRGYANPSYQLLYTANVNNIEEYEPKLEVSEREFVAIDDIEKYHHDFTNFSEILRYTLEKYYDE